MIQNLSFIKNLVLILTLFTFQNFVYSQHDTLEEGPISITSIDTVKNSNHQPSTASISENQEHGEQKSNDHSEAAHHDEEHGHGTDFSPLLFIILALIIGAATRHFLSKIGLPFTVALLIIGILIGLLGRNEVFENFVLFGQNMPTGVLDRAIDWAGDLDPHLILYIFLPILIFEAAFAMDVHTFKKSFTNSVLLAVPGIIVAIILTGLGVWALIYFDLGLQNWSLEIILLFGTVVSATDPVAVVAILKELGASKKLGTLIEGESLLNDGTAIVIFMVIFLGITGQELGYSPFLEFFRVSFGGILIGAIIGFLGLKWMRSVFNDMLIEITLIVALAYLTFFISEHAFGVSGVLGLVTLGLMMAGPGRTKISPEVQHFIHEFWEFTAFTANTLIFLIVGVVIAEKTHFSYSDVWLLLAIYVIIHIVRAIVIALLYPLMNRSGYGLGKNHPQAMWWGALRGAIALALALIVESSPAIPHEVRDEFLFLTAGIVSLTLLINATTMKPVAKILGLTSVSKTKKYVIESAKDYVYQETVSTIDELSKDRFFKKVNWKAAENYLPPSTETEDLEDLTDFKEEARRRILEKEKSSYWAQFKDGLISSGAYNLLVSEINEILDSEGEQLLSDRGDLDELLDTKNSLKKFGLLRKFLSKRYVEKLAASFDAAKGFFMAQQQCMKMLKEMQKSSEKEGESQILEEMEREIEENNIQALTFLRNFKNQYPNIYRHVSTRQAIRTLLNTEKKKVNELLKTGRITAEEAGVLIVDVERRMQNLNKERMSAADQVREKPKEQLS
ncbi:MAG: sodium:proton antiporter [Crocinitomicaceae bacterium]